MTNKLIIAVAIVVIIVMSYSKIVAYMSIEPTTAGRISREWNVSGTYSNKRAAAELLSRANAKMINFMRVLKEKYHINETDQQIAEEGDDHFDMINSPNDLHNIVYHMLCNYNPDAFYENDPGLSSETSYTVNKGSSMYLCLRNKNNPNKLVEESDLLFVLLHEASHIANYKGWGHESDFWTVFKFILHEAQLSGVYVPSDYSRKPILYCGMEVKYNPLYDDLIPNIWE